MKIKVEDKGKHGKWHQDRLLMPISFLQSMLFYFEMSYFKVVFKVIIKDLKALAKEMILMNVVSLAM